MRRSARIAASLLTLGLVVASCGGGDSSDGGESADVETIKMGALTVCTDAPYPPFEFEDETTGEWTGFDMDLMRAIADDIGGLELEVTVQPFDGIWLAPAAGTCDIVASAMTKLPEREENALFSDTYYTADQSLLVLKDNAETYSSLESLAGKTIGVQAGTTGESFANDNTPEGATIKAFDEAAALFLALASGDIDAILQDRPVNAERAAEDETMVMSAILSTGEEYGFAVAMDNTALMDAVNDALKALRDSGEYDTIYSKYFKG